MKPGSHPRSFIAGGTAATIAVSLHQQGVTSSDPGMGFRIVTLLPEAIASITLDLSLTYPSAGPPAVLSSAAPGTVVGIIKPRNAAGTWIPGVPLTLVAGIGDTNNGLHGIVGNELRVTGTLLGINGVRHTVRIQGTGGGGDFAAPLTFTVVLDSDNDKLPDSRELRFGTLKNFAAGGGFDRDSRTDDEEFKDGTDPGDPNSRLILPVITLLGTGTGALPGGDLTDP